MKERERIIFCKQLSQIARAGMGFEEGIGLIAEEGTAPGSRERYIHRAQMVEKLSQGESLVAVLEQENLFSSEMLEMIKVGMDTGNLEEVFNEIADYYERELNIKEQVKTAFYYPLILGSMLLVVMSILIMKVLPIFKEVFEGIGIAATGFTRWLFQTGYFIGIGILILLGSVWFLIFVGNFCARFSKTKKLWAYLTKNNGVLELIDLIRLTSMLSLLIKNGQDFESALKRGEELVGQKGLRNQLEVCRTELIVSADLMEALNQSKLFKPFIRKSLVLSLKVGALESSLKEASHYYEELLEKRLVKKLLIIEPISVGMISLIIGSILLAVMFPLMNLMNTFS